MLRLFSWNINGLRAVINKGALKKILEEESPDFLCLQEIKCKPEQINYNFDELGYKIFWNSAVRPGYSGTAVLAKKNVFAVEKIIELTGVAKEEGRILVLDLKNFYLVNVYTPNSKPNLSRLALREKNWDPNFLTFLKNLEKEKPIITCGDFNAAHEEIDIARPAQNHHSAGFTDEERKGISNLLASGFIDTFRELHPKEKKYSWWSHWGKARENNVGWRIDYFFISKSLGTKLETAEIHEKYLGSDHCPVSIELEN